MTIQTNFDLYIEIVEIPLHLEYADEESISSDDSSDDDTASSASYDDDDDSSSFLDDDEISIDFDSIQELQGRSAIETIGNHDSLVLTRSRGMSAHSSTCMYELDDFGTLNDSIELLLNDDFEQLELEKKGGETMSPLSIALKDAEANLLYLDEDDITIPLTSISDHGKAEGTNKIQRRRIGRGRRLIESNHGDS